MSPPIEKTLPLSEVYDGRLTYFNTKKYNEVSSDTPKNIVSRSQKIIAYLEKDSTFDPSKTSPQQKRKREAIIQKYTDLINSYKNQQNQEIITEPEPIKETPETQTVNIEKIKENPDQELQKISQQKNDIITRENTIDAKNALTISLPKELEKIETLDIDTELKEKYIQNIKIDAKDYAIFLVSKTKPSNIQKYLTETLNISDIFSQQEIKEIINEIQPSIFTNIADIQTAVKTNTLFKTYETQERNFRYSPLVVFNTKDEKIPILLSAEIEAQRENLKKKGFITKIKEIKQDNRVTPEEVKINKELINEELINEALESYEDAHETMSLLHARFQVDADSTNDEYRENTANGEIGDSFRGRSGVHCAEYVAMYLNRKLNLPKGRIIAGDSWTMIENLLKGSLAKEITARHDKYNLTTSKQHRYNRTKIFNHYKKIKEGFKKSNLPMVLGVHYLYTGTDRTQAEGGNAKLLTAQKQFQNKTRGKNGKLAVPYKPTANSHVFAMENNFSRETSGKGRPLSSILKALWNSNRYRKQEKGASLDMSSPLISDLHITYTNKNGEKITTTVGEAGLNKKIDGTIKITGIGVSDEIGGSVKKSFFAFRMSTKVGNKSMYTFVQAAQIDTEDLQNAEKVYKKVIGDIDVKYTQLKSIKSDWTLYNKIKHNFYKNYKNTGKQTKEQINNIIQGRYLDALKTQLITESITPPIKEYSPLYFKVQSFYTQFFRISGVTKASKIPTFSSRADLEKAIANHEALLETKHGYLKTYSGFVEIGKEKNNGITTTTDLMKAFWEKSTEGKKEKIDIDFTNPAITKAFFVFLHKIGNYNKGSYFDAVIDESVKHSNLEKNEIFTQFFTQKSKIFYTQSQLEELFTHIQKTNFHEQQKNIQNIEKTFQDIPWDTIRKPVKEGGFGFPLSEPKLYALTHGNGEKMRALITIWMRETGWDNFKDWKEGEKGSEKSFKEYVDDFHAQYISGKASAGQWQVKIPFFTGKENTPPKKIFTKNKKLFSDFITNLNNKINNAISQKVLKISEEDVIILKNIVRKTEQVKDMSDINSYKKDIHALAIKYPEIGAMLAIMHMDRNYNSAKTSLTNATKDGEVLEKRQVYEHIINSWASPVADKQSIHVNVLQDTLQKLGLNDITKKIKTEERGKRDNKTAKEGILKTWERWGQLKGLKANLSPSEKGKIRTIEMTRGIIEHLADFIITYNDTKKENKSLETLEKQAEYKILKSLQQELKQESISQIGGFFTKVLQEIAEVENNPDSNALMLSTQNNVNGSDLKTYKYPYFKILFSALRNASSSSLNLNSKKITDKSSKYMGNYLGYSKNALHKIKEEEQEKTRSGMSRFLEKQKSRIADKNESITNTKIVSGFKKLLSTMKERGYTSLNLQSDKKSAKIIQQFLFDQGLYEGKIDGEFYKESYEAINKINSISLSYKNREPLHKKDIESLITYFETKTENIKTNTYTAEIDAINKIDTELSDEYFIKHTDKKVQIGILHGALIRVNTLEKFNKLPAQKITHLKNKILQIGLQILNLYTGSIDGDMGSNSIKALNKFIEKSNYNGEENIFKFMITELNKTDFSKIEEETMFTYSGVLPTPNIPKFNQYKNKPYGNGRNNINCMSTMDNFENKYYNNFAQSEHKDVNITYNTYFTKYAPQKYRKKINPEQYPFEKNKIYLIAIGDGHHSGFLTIDKNGEKLFSHAGVNFIHGTDGKIYDYAQSDQYKNAVTKGNLDSLRKVTNVKRVSSKKGRVKFVKIDKNKPINLTFNKKPIEWNENQEQGGFYTQKWEDFVKSNPKDTKSVYLQELEAYIPTIKNKETQQEVIKENIDIATLQKYIEKYNSDFIQLLAPFGPTGKKAGRQKVSFNTLKENIGTNSNAEKALHSVISFFANKENTQKVNKELLNNMYEFQKNTVSGDDISNGSYSTKTVNGEIVSESFAEDWVKINKKLSTKFNKENKQYYTISSGYRSPAYQLVLLLGRKGKGQTLEEKLSDTALPYHSEHGVMPSAFDVSQIHALHKKAKIQLEQYMKNNQNKLTTETEKQEKFEEIRNSLGFSYFREVLQNNGYDITYDIGSSVNNGYGESWHFMKVQ